MDVVFVYKQSTLTRIADKTLAVPAKKCMAHIRWDTFPKSYLKITSFRTNSTEFESYNVVKRPGVAGAVLKTPL